MVLLLNFPPQLPKEAVLIHAGLLLLPLVVCGLPIGRRLAIAILLAAAVCAALLFSLLYSLR